MSMMSMKLPLSKLPTVSPTAIPSSPLNDEEQLDILHEFESVHPVPPQLLSCVTHIIRSHHLSGTPLCLVSLGLP